LIIILIPRWQFIAAVGYIAALFPPQCGNSC
jgi:hypothetical protein